MVNLSDDEKKKLGEFGEALRDYYVLFKSREWGDPELLAATQKKEALEKSLEIDEHKSKSYYRLEIDLVEDARLEEHRKIASGCRGRRVDVSELLNILGFGDILPIIHEKEDYLIFLANDILPNLFRYKFIVSQYTEPEPRPDDDIPF